MPNPQQSFTPVSRLLTTEYPAEVHSLTQLPSAEGETVLRQILKETQGVNAEDLAARVAEKLRDVLGLAKDETEQVNVLPRESSDRFDAICAAVAR